MRAPIAAAVLLLAAGPAHAASALARLAEALADQIAAVAKDRAVELAVPEDRTGRGGAFALDLLALVAARLEGRVALHDTGPRLRIVSVLSETPRRLVASARVVEDPGGRLVDLLSASVEADEALLGLSPERTPPPGRALDVVSALRTPPIDGSVLDLALLGTERMAVLGGEDLALYRWDSTGLVPESRQPLPGPLVAVRAPGGRIVASRDDDAVWVLTSRSPKAVLFGLRGGRLTRRSDAAALPWPGCPGGLRYRPGTNLLEGTIGVLGPGPFLALAAADRPMAVGVDGELRLAAEGSPTRGPRVGPMLAPLWKGFVATSSADPPGSRDTILLVAEGDGEPRVVDTIPVDGAVRALAARTQGDTARLAAAVEEPGGATRLLLLDLRRREP